MFGTMAEKKTAVKYLIKLGIGWAIGMGMAVVLLSALFESHIYIVSSLFFGLMLGAVPLIAKEERESLQRKPQWAVFCKSGNPAVPDRDGCHIGNVPSGHVWKNSVPRQSI